jgi:hypothetical protein
LEFADFRAPLCYNFLKRILHCHNRRRFVFMREDSKCCPNDCESAHAAAPRARQAALMKCVAAPFGLCFFYFVRGANDQSNAEFADRRQRAISGGA